MGTCCGVAREEAEPPLVPRACAQRQQQHQRRQRSDTFPGSAAASREWLLEGVGGELRREDVYSEPYAEIGYGEA